MVDGRRRKEKVFKTTGIGITLYITYVNIMWSMTWNTFDDSNKSLWQLKEGLDKMDAMISCQNIKVNI